MKNILKVNHSNAELIMDRTFAKKAAIVGSQEYTKLQMARNDYPTYTVKLRQIKRNPNKECYRGLTYEYMETYIKTHANAVSRFREYEEMRQISECHSVRYPAIKNWFLSKYPEVAKYGLQSSIDLSDNDESAIVA